MFSFIKKNKKPSKKVIKISVWENKKVIKEVKIIHK